MKKASSKKPTSPDCSATRRQFLQTTAGALAVSSLLAGCDKEEVGDEDGGEADNFGTDTNHDNNDSDNNTGTAPSNRVVRVTDPASTSWDGENPKSGHKWGYLKFAADADHNLGTFEMREETGADTYRLIDLVRINH